MFNVGDIVTYHGAQLRECAGEGAYIAGQDAVNPSILLLEFINEPYRSRYLYHRCSTEYLKLYSAGAYPESEVG